MYGTPQDLRSKQAIQDSQKYEVLIKFVSKKTLWLRLLQYMIGINFSKNSMILVTVFVNLAFYLIADKNFDRFGPDTTAYINQAG